MSHLVIGFAGNLLAIIVAMILWGGHRPRPSWVSSFPVLVGVLLLNVAGWLAVIA